jgi:hypothetical protein
LYGEKPNALTLEKNKPDLSLIRKYLNGELDARAMYLLERHAQEDPALMDLITGMEGGNSIVDETNLADLHVLIAQRVQQEQIPKRISWKKWAIAASLLFIGGLAGLYIFRAPQSIPALQVKTKTTLPTKPLSLDPTQIKGGIPYSAFNKAENKMSSTLSKVSIPEIKAKAGSRPVASKLTNNAPSIEIPRSRPAKTVQSPASTALAGRVAGIQINPSDAAALALNARKSERDSNNFGGDLNEVVVVGYAKQKKAGVTASSSSVMIRGNSSIAADSGMKTMLHKMPKVIFDPATLKGRGSPVNGWVAYKKYLDDNAHIAGIKGKVTLAFNVDHDGKPVNIRVIKSLTAETDNLAIALLIMGSKWAGDNGQLPKEVTLKIRFH